MKNLLIKLFAIIAITIGFASCTECIECSFRIPMTTIDETSGEQCGTTDEIGNVEAEWTQFAIDAGTTVSCIRN